MIEVVLVNAQDEPIGLCEKLKAHELGLLHRAFSVIVFRENAGNLETLLQQRAASKYHCPEYWTNACCSHPIQNESLTEACIRRMQEEFGYTMQHIAAAGSFVYQAPLENNLIEHEFDHVFFSIYQGEMLNPHADEIMNYAWVPVETLDTWLADKKTTPWFWDAFALAKTAYQKSR